MIESATIANTFLGNDDHGFTFWVTVDYGDASQGFGGYTLYGEFTHYILSELLNTLEVKSWEELKGTPVRVKAQKTHITSIGHYTKDKWFTPSEYKKECDHCFASDPYRFGYCKHCGEDL